MANQAAGPHLPTLLDHRTRHSWPRLLLALAVLLALVLPVAQAYHVVRTQSGFEALFWNSDANNTVSNTGGMRLAVDSAGGVHMAYVEAGGQEWLAVYGYCPTDCADPTSWSRATVGAGLGTDIYWAELGLDRSTSPNRPRLLLRGVNPDYIYAACDTNCTSAAQWQYAVVVQNSSYAGSFSNFFALDSLGRPRFVYSDESWDTGTHYLWCDMACTNPASWQRVEVTGDKLELPALALTPGGARLVGYAYLFDGSRYVNRLQYWECSSDCASAASWSGVSPYQVVGTASFPTWYSLRVDGQGRPRLALFPGSSPSISNSSFPQETLYYVWCDAGCLQTSNWRFTTLPGARVEAYYGSYPDLQLDSAGRPQISYRSADGLGYAACSGGCQSNAGSWSLSMVESNAELNQSHPVAPPAGCSNPTWDLGHYSALVLSPEERPLFGYNARHLVTCGVSPQLDAESARYAQSGPAAPEYKVHVPLLRR